MIVFPNCKINLGLFITGKRPDGYHNLETAFYPIAIQDALELIESDDATNEISFTSSGLRFDGDIEKNICIKAYHLIKKDFDLPPVKMHLHKVIPVGAGLGGGSSDAAFTLKLLNEKFSLQISDEKLMQYALKLGSDCPFFIYNKPCIAKSRGEEIYPVEINLSAYSLVLIHPGIHINTAWAFSKLTLQTQERNIENIVSQPINNWKEQLTNDFEEVIFKEYPLIKQIKQQLYSKGAVFATMSGSGSTVFGLFLKEQVPELDFDDKFFVKTLAL